MDAAGCIVTPGFVDLHAHLREPGFEQKGTIATETEAALRGGFTTVCAMPNTDPPPDSAPAVEGLLKRVSQDARVRVLPVGCTTVGREGKQLAALSELAEAGCVAISDDGSPVSEGSLMRNALTLAGGARTGGGGALRRALTEREGGDARGRGQRTARAAGPADRRGGGGDSAKRRALRAYRRTVTHHARDDGERCGAGGAAQRSAGCPLRAR